MQPRTVKGAEVLQREALLNDAFIRSFRDTADGDYIAARLAYRVQLIPQFHWASLQAIEKYLKCILTLNRIKAKTGHDLEKALNKSQQELRFQLRLSDSSLLFIKHLDTFGRFRYLETPYHTETHGLIKLDRAVWELRRYCTPIDRSRILTPSEAKERLDFELRLIEAAEDKPNEFGISGGFLEKVIASKKHPARSGLVWMNFYYGAKARRTVTLEPFFSAVNSPLSLHPELIEEFCEYASLQDEIIKAYRKEHGTKGNRPPKPGTMG